MLQKSPGGSATPRSRYLLCPVPAAEGSAGYGRPPAALGVGLKGPAVWLWPCLSFPYSPPGCTWLLA